MVQKWIDNLWENKYKDRGNDTPTQEPNGTVELPYQITLTESEGVFTATINVDFSTVTDV